MFFKIKILKYIIIDLVGLKNRIIYYVVMIDWEMEILWFVK